jgi:hypothetical protein
MEAALESTGALAHQATFGADKVFQVAPGVFDPATLDVTAYLPPVTTAGQVYTAYAVLFNRGVESYAVAPTDGLAASVGWQGQGKDISYAATGNVPLVISPGGAAVVPLDVEAPAVPGTYRVSVRGTTWFGHEWRAEGEVVAGSDPVAAAFPVPVRLAGWSLPGVVGAGQDLPVDLTWDALGKIDAYYSVYVKLLDEAGNTVAGWDGQPRDGELPTLLWVPGERVEDRVTLQVPPDLAPGEYCVEVGMYRAADLARCLTLAEDGRLVPSVSPGMVRVQP